MDHIDDSGLEPQPVTPEEPRRRGWAGWLISGAFHAMLLALMATVYWLIAETEPSVPIVADGWTPAKVPKVVKPPADPLPVEVPDTPTPDESDHPTPPSEVVTDITTPSTDDHDQPETSPGSVAALADQEFDSNGVLISIGAASNDSGMFSNRPGPGGPRGPGHRPPTGCPPKDDAIKRALRWFKRHQSPDGSWDAARYPVNCTDDPKCEPGDATVGGEVNVAMTGYAVTCFLGDGYDHRTPSVFRDTVRKGLDYLVAVQKADGLLGARNYEHAIAAKALIEAYAMTGDPALKDPAQKAVDVIVARQNRDPSAADQAYAGLGWDYVDPTDRNDSSVTGWNVMALKSAFAAQLNVGHAFDGAKRWLHRTWELTNPGFKQLDPYKDESRFPYTLMASSAKIDIAPAPAANAPGPDAHDLACVGLMSAVFLGAHSGDAMLETLANYVDRHELPAAYPCNTYKLYYDCLGIYQVGGEKWRRWDRQVTKLLTDAQRRDGCYDGSWDFQDTRFHGHQAGRVLSTAYCCLSLEACYLYRRVTGAR